MIKKWAILYRFVSQPSDALISSRDENTNYTCDYGYLLIANFAEDSMTSITDPTLYRKIYFLANSIIRLIVAYTTLRRKFGKVDIR